MTRKVFALVAVLLLVALPAFARGPIISEPQPPKKGPIVSEPKVVEAATNPLFQAASWFWNIVVQKPPKMN